MSSEGGGPGKKKKSDGLELCGELVRLGVAVNNEDLQGSEVSFQSPHGDLLFTVVIVEKHFLVARGYREDRTETEAL